MEMLLLGVTVIFRPVETFRMIKLDRNRFNYLPPLIFLVMALAARIFYVFTVHFPLADINPWDTSIAVEAIKVMVPLVTWIFACYAITSILGGESHLREVLMAASLSMIPYIFLSVVLSLFSKVLCGTELPLFLFLSILMWVWVGTLIFVSVMVMNDYTLWQTLGIIFLSILSMLLIWAVAVLVYALANQFIQFILGLIQEIRINFG